MFDALKNLFVKPAEEQQVLPSISFETTPVALPGIATLGDLKGKRVLLRASLNVPVQEGRVENSFRLKSILPTIVLLQEQGARIVLIGHIGREPKETLRPVFEALNALVPLTDFLPLTGEETVSRIDALKEGEIVMLENLRSEEGEEENDDAFATLLASYGDVYVNDAFADSHRTHASIVGVPKLLPSAFGISFVTEYEALMKAIHPASPSLLILGGAKFETKLPLVEKYLQVYDHVFVGGALANDVFKAKGFEVGQSLVSTEPLALTHLLQNKKLLLPVDVTVKGDTGTRVTAPESVNPTENMLDVGPATIAMLEPYVREATTILWNGPLGNYEAGFAQYTEQCAELIGKSDAYSIVGGGDTIATIEKKAIGNAFGFLSTAGGAMLVFLESGSLPGIDAVIANR